MPVDSPTSLVGGRTNWAMPKTLARFDGEPAAGATMTATGTEQIAWSVSASAHVIGPALPVIGRGTALQEFPDGRIGHSVLTLTGRARAAMVTVEVTSDGTLPTWLRPGRHLGALLEKGKITLGRPRFE
jgi:hypothetical protein